MSARSAERWELVGYDSDPTPGDPDEIAAVATHLTTTATTISDQVTRLRQLAKSDSELVGEYADNLRDACEKTAGHLEKVHDRYASVGALLTPWAETVRTVRRETLAAVDAAEQATRTLDLNPEPAPRHDTDPPLTAQERAHRDSVHATRSSAVTALTNAVAAAHTAANHHNTAAETLARDINTATTDQMKDGGWDRIKNWVHEHADLLKGIAEVLSWVATIIAVIALFCTPAGWVVLLAVALTAGVLLLHTALALSGDGNWADVALDVVSLLTFGTGKIAINAAKAGRAATLTSIGKFTASAARTDAVNAAKAAFKEASFFKKPLVWLTKSNPLAAWSAARRAASETLASWVNRPLPQLSKLEGFMKSFAFGGDRELAATAKEARELASTPEFAKLFDPRLLNGLRLAKLSFGVSALSDAGDKAAGDSSLWKSKPTWDSYQDFKDSLSYSPGGWFL